MLYICLTCLTSFSSSGMIRQLQINTDPCYYTVHYYNFISLIDFDMCSSNLELFWECFHNDREVLLLLSFIIIFNLYLKSCELDTQFV